MKVKEKVKSAKTPSKVAEKKNDKIETPKAATKKKASK